MRSGKSITWVSPDPSRPHINSSWMDSVSSHFGAIKNDLSGVENAQTNVAPFVGGTRWAAWLSCSKKVVLCKASASFEQRLSALHASPTPRFFVIQRRVTAVCSAYFQHLRRSTTSGSRHRARKGKDSEAPSTLRSLTLQVRRHFSILPIASLSLTT